MSENSKFQLPNHKQTQMIEIQKGKIQIPHSQIRNTYYIDSNH
jgi:hypothetical protein